MRDVQSLLTKAELIRSRLSVGGEMLAPHHLSFLTGL